VTGHGTETPSAARRRSDRLAVALAFGTSAAQMRGSTLRTITSRRQPHSRGPRHGAVPEDAPRSFDTAIAGIEDARPEIVATKDAVDNP
jgi:hypothetical protein